MPLKLAIGLLVLGLQAGFPGAALGPTPPSASPYASALATIPESTSIGGHVHCFRTCTANNTCTSSSLPTVCLTSNGVCATGTCR